MRAATLRDREVERNYHFLRSAMDDLLQAHAGKYALLRHQSVVRIYDDEFEAVDAGAAEFTDGLFSVQEITDRPDLISAL